MSILKGLAACAAGVELGSSPAAPAIHFPRFPSEIRGFFVYVPGLEANSANFLPTGQIIFNLRDLVCSSLP